MVFTKKHLAIILVVIALGEGGYFLYQKQFRSDRRTVAIMIVPVDDPVIAQGIKEGAQLAIAGVNATKDFSIRMAFGKENPIAIIGEEDGMLVIRSGGEGASGAAPFLSIPRGGLPGAVFIRKVKLVYGHDPLPYSAEAFDAVKLIAIGSSRIPLGKPMESPLLQEIFKSLRGYTGESGAVKFNEGGIGSR